MTLYPQGVRRGCPLLRNDPYAVTWAEGFLYVRNIAGNLDSLSPLVGRGLGRGADAEMSIFRWLRKPPSACGYR